MPALMQAVLAALIASGRPMPVEVRVHPDGSIELMTADRPDLASHDRYTIPVWSEHPDGRRERGVRCGFLTGQGRSFLGDLVWADDRWHPSFSTWFTWHGAGLPEGELLPRSEECVVYVSRGFVEGPTSATRRTSELTYTYDHSAAPQGLAEADVRAAIDRAVTLWIDVMRDANLIHPPIEISWAPLGGALASTGTKQFTNHPWSVVRGALTAAYAANPIDQDGPEELALDNLPAGSSVPFRAQSTNQSASLIALDDGVSNALGLPPPGSATSVRFDSARVWVVAPELPVAPGVAGFDFTEVAVHEIGHVLGYLSFAEIRAEGSAAGPITLLDVFRLNETDVGPAVSDSEMLGSRRELTLGVNAALATGLNQPGVPGFSPMSSGGVPASTVTRRHQASHWEEFPTASLANIGIMDALTDLFGAAPAGNTYLRPADIHAMDMLGYAIDRNRNFGPRAAPGGQAPAPGVLIEALPPVSFQWTPGQEATEHVLVVWENTPDPVVVVRVSQGGNATSATVPGGTFVRGREYNWRVTAFTTLGYGHSDTRSFRIRCPADVTRDGQVDAGDLQLFIDAFIIGDAAVADFTGDGQVDSGDLQLFITAFLAGC